MARGAVAARHFAARKPVVDVPPMVRRDLAGIDTRRLNGIDQAENLRDFRPTMNAEQDIAAWINLWHSCARFARIDGPDDV